MPDTITINLADIRSVWVHHPNPNGNGHEPLLLRYGCVVEQARRQGGTFMWTVREGAASSMPVCLSKSGAWVYEPQPSSRTELFYEDCRWQSYEEAVEAARKAVAHAKRNASACIPLTVKDYYNE